MIRSLDVQLVAFGYGSARGPCSAEDIFESVFVRVGRTAAMAIGVDEGALIDLREVSVAGVYVEARHPSVTAEEDVGVLIVVEVGGDSTVGAGPLANAGVRALIDCIHRYPA